MKDTKASWMYIGGKRLNGMKIIAEAFFGEALMDIRIDTSKRIFIIKIEDSVPATQIKKFSDKYHGFCDIIPFQKKQLKEVCKECK